MLVRRDGPRVSVIEDDRVLWSGTIDGSITYPQDGQTWTRMVNRCTDQDLVNTVRKIEQR